MRVEMFSEVSENGGFIRRMDARVKIIVVAACLVLAVASSNPAAPVTIGIVCLALLLASGAPLKTVLFRVSEPLFFALMLALFQLFLTGGAPLARFEVFGLNLSPSAQGL